jgi:hypothetical protein
MPGVPKLSLHKKTITTSSHTITHLVRISRHYKVILLRAKNKLILSKNKLILSKNKPKKLKKRNLKWQSSMPNLVVFNKWTIIILTNYLSARREVIWVLLIKLIWLPIKIVASSEISFLDLNSPALTAIKYLS